MKLNELKSGNVVTLRNGDRMMVIKDFNGYESVFFDIINNEWESFDNYNENMECLNEPFYDIVQVERIKTPCDYINKIVVETIWVRKEEVNWNEVKVDTPIYVRDSASEDWEPRHFAKYEGGAVYVFDYGRTSHTTDAVSDWRYAKLK